MASSDIVLATINAKWIHPSLALRLLKANLGSLEARCEILEFALRQPLSEKVEPIIAARPRILGLSVSIWNHLATLELLKALAAEWEKTTNEEPAARQKPLIVLGGPEVSWLPEEAEIFRYADYIIRGEGEESFCLLCYRVFDESRLAKETETWGEKTIFNNQGGTNLDVKKIETAYHLYTDEDLQRKLVYVEASRGCPFSCEFCQAAMQGVREFPLEPFLAEMENLIDRGGRTFKFLDRTFNLDIDRAKKIMEFFLERIDTDTITASSQVDIAGTKAGVGNRPLCVHFEMLPSRFPPALRELLRRFPSGSLRLEVGIQTLNQKTAALVGRCGDQTKELEALEFLCRESNAILHVDLIAGLPGEDLSSFGAGFDRLWQILSGKKPAADFSTGNGRSDREFFSRGFFEIQVGILKCLPGTSIARHNEIYKMRYAPEPPYEVIETGAIPAAELAKIKNFARFWELIVNRNPFPDLTCSLLPAGGPAFDKFMDLSDRLLKYFGRNWGIDREELKSFLLDNQA